MGSETWNHDRQTDQPTDRRTLYQRQTISIRFVASIAQFINLQTFIREYAKSHSRNIHKIVQAEGTLGNYKTSKISIDII